jgi:alpha-beta hydrolase superfamily lysophospholipase
MTELIEKHSIKEIEFTTISYLLNSDKVVYYLHGYNDYFFHTHVAEFFNSLGYDFVAIDLHGCGRSKLNGESAHQVKCLTDYDAEILKVLDSNDYKSQILYGHSTGALIWMYFIQRHKTDKETTLVLNSPFFEFNVSKWKKKLLLPIIDFLAPLIPDFRIKRKSLGYGKSLHLDYGGEWDFNTNSKDLNGLGVTFGWISTIHKAQESLKYYSFSNPILILSSDFTVIKKEDILKGDSVLSVEDISRVVSTFSGDINHVKIQSGLHDVLLSSKGIRDYAFNIIKGWIFR